MFRVLFHDLRKVQLQVPNRLKDIKSWKFSLVDWLMLAFKGNITKSNDAGAVATGRHFL